MGSLVDIPGTRRFRSITVAQMSQPQDTPTSPEYSMDGPPSLDDILKLIQSRGFSLGDFLVTLFTVPSRDSESRSPTHRQMVSKFLGGATKVHAADIVDLIYNSKDATPKAVRKSNTPTELKARRDEELMARWRLKEWAVGTVEKIIDAEAEELASKGGGLRLPLDLSWDFVRNFSLDHVLSIVKCKSPTFLRMLTAAAIPRKKRLAESSSSTGNTSSNVSEEPYTTTSCLFTEASHAGSGHNRRNPFVIILVTLLMLLNARNLQFTGFQKLIGVWLFANSASSYVFTILGRIGLSVSLSTTLDILQKLSESAQKTVREKAIHRIFLLIYDNINRMLRVWDPELGEQDVMDSGTAATFVELEDCDPEKAMDINVLENARGQQGRKSLSYAVLHNRVKWDLLHKIMVVHALSFLVQEVPKLYPLQETLTSRLRTTQSIHRMRDGRKTTTYPLATSNHDEGSTGGNQKVLDDLMLRQLHLDRDEIPKMLTIVGGDQSTTEKVRTLKRFLNSCPHGYASYGWVLPLIQLWHMGWADLERILSTHWGNGNGLSDISTFCFLNEKLGRKVKNVKRPDFYPAQALVFDTLQAEVLDCWREVLETDNLELYFDRNEKSLADLLIIAEKIVNTYMSSHASQQASRVGNRNGLFKTGSAWRNPSESSVQTGDQVLCNTILRMRDSMLHYEFQSAIADGDIGRAMNVMAVWTFTFCGSGKSKYTNELLELTCNFEYEYSDALQEAIMNNWLCNLTGFDGCWFPMDLLQEHNIRQLKALSDRRKSSFGSEYFKNVIAYNIRYFLETKESLQVATGLSKKKGGHRRKKKTVGLMLLAQMMKEHQLHRYREGRTYDHKASDDFAEGSKTLDRTSRIQDFIQRTLADSSNIHGTDEDVVMGESGTEEEDKLDNSGEGELPLPNIIHDGVLFTAADIDRVNRI